MYRWNVLHGYLLLFLTIVEKWNKIIQNGLDQ